MQRNTNNIHVCRRQVLSHAFGGIDEDIERAFLSLSPNVLHRILEHYKWIHGAKKHAYAKKTYAKWKSGDVFMSGEVCERLLAIVPGHLDFGSKYDLIEKLWRRQDTARLKVTVDLGTDVDEAVEAVEKAIDCLGDKGIPESLAARLNWLTENDAVVAHGLFKQVLKQGHALSKQALRPQLQKILNVRQDAPASVSVEASYVLRIPGGTVEVIISDRGSPKKSRSKRMADELQKATGNFVPVEYQPQDGQMAPIQNPDDLLGEALQRMSAQKQAEVLGTAANEALRLQVKVAENKIDQDVLSKKLDQAARVAHDAAVNDNVRIDFTTEHKSEQGDTRIHVTSSPNKPEAAHSPHVEPNRPGMPQNPGGEISGLGWLILIGVFVLIALAIALRH